MRHDRREQIRQMKNFCAREEFFNRERRRRRCKSSARARHSHTQNRTAKLKCKMYTEKKKRSSFYLCRAERDRERERERELAQHPKSHYSGFAAKRQKEQTECMQISQAMQNTPLNTRDHFWNQAA
jgi:hypothetical protein